MSKSETRRQKRTDHNCIDDRNTDTVQPYATRDVSLIDEATIRRLDDEAAEEDGCRFAAVARSLEQKHDRENEVKLPITRVAYVDESGRYGIEREFFGYKRDWNEIPRTVVVTDGSVVREIPERHRERYAPILEMYQRVLAEE
ncbi:hypothetical protein [Halopiger xanaduensis]|uniref:Uncharacterized protein n=1 Tax=Halopiger xanaduensis (strain DSM 18323 / JCM 14033 / SH-6) TaxID=797210 RepID=F8DEL6_HALXS|nr:hypothetical protein [Halopiger xanaduensis]AEH39453.1 hypothetical protein Halxa_0213 [Halopiger xanaduensis SH-6]